MSSKTNVPLEMRILRTLCDGSAKTQGYVLPLLKEMHFSAAATQGLFRRLIRLHAKGSVIPSWRDFAHDPGVSPDTRKMMKSVTVKPMKTEQRIDSTLSTLENLRKVRMLYEAGANLEKMLEDADEQGIDPDAVLEQLQKDITLVGSNTVQTVFTRRGGKDSNVKSVVKKILLSKGQRRIPTGIEDFDARNIGFVDDGVVLLAASTGGGKTALLNQIIEFMAVQGLDVASLPLEMGAEENIMRSMAKETSATMDQLIDPMHRMTREERKRTMKEYMAYDRRITQNGGSIDIIEPGFSTTVENILAFLDPLDYKVIAIDYVALMDGVNGDDQWRALSAAVAYAKKYASRPHKKTLIIFAAQITEDNFLKNSKAMQDHCTNMIRWRVGEEERESGIVVLNQDKCRGGAVFPIPMHVDFTKMFFRALTKTELEDWQLSQKEAKPGKGGKSRWKPGSSSKKDKEKKPDLDEDEDEDDRETVVKVKPRKVKRRASEY